MKLPTVLNLIGPVVVFGGGVVGLRKVEYISNFTKDIMVVAEDVQSLPDHVRYVSARLDSENISTHIPDDTSLVVAALSDVELNHAIAEYCTNKGILVNVVDDPEPSTVIFPALSSEGDLNIAISTSGKCPFLARKIRIEVDDWISVKAGWLEVLAPIRESLTKNPNKDKILLDIYNDMEIGKLIAKGKIEEAKQKAREVIDVHSQS
jgi:siroheme synthase-like protein